MKIGKLFKYDAISKFPNVIEHSFVTRVETQCIASLHGLQTTPPNNIFEKKQPIILELGCGKGDYSLHLAKNNPQKNIIGVDIKGARIYHGASFALENNIKNLIFLRISIEYIASFYSLHFPSSKIAEIWINFPDPRSNRKSAALKRLTSPKFLQVYKSIIQSDTILHLKTDSNDMYNYTLSVLNEDWHIIEATDNLYGNNNLCPASEFQTDYEKRYLALGEKIKYIRFGLK